MKVRIKFSKYGAMRFVGHLDMLRFFQKALRRAGVEVAYSGGFSPHPLISFAAPLGLGLSSRAEYFDVELASPDPHDIKTRLAAQMVPGVEIISVTVLPEGAAKAMASVFAAAYTVSFKKTAPLPLDWISQFEAFLRLPEISYLKITKKVERMMNLAPLIYESRINAENRAIYLLVNASSADSIKPQFVIEAFIDHIGQRFQPSLWDICREEIYRNTGTAEKPCLVPLDDI